MPQQSQRQVAASAVSRAYWATFRALNECAALGHVETCVEDLSAIAMSLHEMSEDLNLPLTRSLRTRPRSIA
jgi:hypothetical protein